VKSIDSPVRFLSLSWCYGFGNCENAGPWATVANLKSVGATGVGVEQQWNVPPVVNFLFLRDTPASCCVSILPLVLLGAGDQERQHGSLGV
jgi:hypothetical protein